MIDLEGRGLEILRWFLAIAAGAIVIPIQSWLFRSGSIALWDVDPTRWVASIFERASLIVWSVSLIGSVIWYMMAVQMRRHFAPKDTIGDGEMVDCAVVAAAGSNRQYLGIRKSQHSGIPLVCGFSAPQYGVDVLAFHCRIDSFTPSPCGAVSL
ncbi:hypothetical protein [Arthrospira platensis]|uniref:hypothetical protein n=1 Tax=Limnospira platensis TaxID=118562 RepID=UPI0007A0E24E|nr:hypothetical protein [Arthrospira platensis]AMW27453.1 hypothetical protein AP285_05115 [Arthrospira platensis YZ]MBD2668036.1 hypothetical protein [Arthrospira platensis FACHB-439]MBD2709947.1 hypothetical protein [Arthrospira platensis FACHB-835]QQW30211.1 hypothetical protein AP9108_05410 [Arthrospira sp. PCC 9108]MBD2572914.1 hypothetical protein [Arthrospira platensis FACHB-971]